MHVNRLFFVVEDVLVLSSQPDRASCLCQWIQLSAKSFSSFISMQAVYGGQPNTMYPYVDTRGQYQGYARQVSVSEPQPRPMYNGMQMNSHNGHNFDINTDGPSYFYGGVPPEAPSSHHGTPFPHQPLLLSNGTPAGVPNHLPQPAKRHHSRHASLPAYNGEPITRHRTVSYKREEEEIEPMRVDEDMTSCVLHSCLI